MEKDAAHRLLGLDDDAGASDVEAASRRRLAELDHRIAAAPSEALRAKYRATRAEVELAAAALSPTTPAEGDALRDLPVVGAAPTAPTAARAAASPARPGTPGEAAATPSPDAAMPSARPEARSAGEHHSPSLREEIERRRITGRRFEVAEVVRIGRALCDAASARPEAARALRPEDVLVGRDGEVEIATAGRAGSGGPATDEDPLHAVAAILHEILFDVPPGAAAPRRADVPAALAGALQRALATGSPSRPDAIAALRDALVEPPAASRRASWRVPAAVTAIALAVLAVGVLFSPNAGRWWAKFAPVDLAADPSEAQGRALDAQGRATALRGQIDTELRRLADRSRSAEANLRTVQGQMRSTKTANEQIRAAARVEEARKASDAAQRLKTAAETEVLGGKALAAVEGRLAVGEGHLREGRFEEATAAYAAAQALVEGMLRELRDLESPAAAPGSQRIRVPSIDGEVRTARLFLISGPQDGAPSYGNRFPAGRGTLGWEVELEHLPSSAPVELSFSAGWYDAKGDRVANDDVPSRIEPGWSASVHSGLAARPLAAGRYKLVLVLDGTEIASLPFDLE